MYDISTAHDAVWLDAEHTQFQVIINDVPVIAYARPGLTLWEALKAADFPIAEYVAP